MVERATSTDLPTILDIVVGLAMAFGDATFFDFKAWLGCVLALQDATMFELKAWLRCILGLGVFTERIGRL